MTTTAGSADVDNEPAAGALKPADISGATALYGGGNMRPGSAGGMSFTSFGVSSHSAASFGAESSLAFYDMDVDPNQPISASTSLASELMDFKGIAEEVEEKTTKRVSGGGGKKQTTKIPPTTAGEYRASVRGRSLKVPRGLENVLSVDPNDPGMNCMRLKERIGVNVLEAKILLCSPIALPYMESWHFYEQKRRGEIVEHERRMRKLAHEAAFRNREEGMLGREQSWLIGNGDRFRTGFKSGPDRFQTPVSSQCRMSDLRIVPVTVPLLPHTQSMSLYCVLSDLRSHVPDICGVSCRICGVLSFRIHILTEIQESSLKVWSNVGRETGPLMFGVSSSGMVIPKHVVERLAPFAPPGLLGGVRPVPEGRDGSSSEEDVGVEKEREANQDVLMLKELRGFRRRRRAAAKLLVEETERELVEAELSRSGGSGGGTQ